MADSKIVVRQQRMEISFFRTRGGQPRRDFSFYSAHRKIFSRGSTAGFFFSTGGSEKLRFFFSLNIRTDSKLLNFLRGSQGARGIYGWGNLHMQLKTYNFEVEVTNLSFIGH